MASAIAKRSASPSMFERVSERRSSTSRLGAAVELLVEVVHVGLAEAAAPPPVALGAAQIHVPAAPALLEPLDGLHELALAARGRRACPRPSGCSRRRSFVRLTLMGAISGASGRIFRRKLGIFGAEYGRLAQIGSGAVVLSDKSIGEEMDRGGIVIEPLGDGALQPSSVDLRVDRFFRVFRNDTTPYIDPKQPQEDLTELVEVDEGGSFILHPGEFVLGSTLERVALGDDLVARLEGKSSLGRLGPAHPQHRRLRRCGLGRAPDAGALERREPADRDLPRDEDRPDLLPCA